MDVNWIYFGNNHFAIYTYIKPCCTPKTNVLHVNDISIKLKEIKNNGEGNWKANI